MQNHIFSSLVSITKGLHRDLKSEREFEQLINTISSEELIATNSVFEINFKRPLTFKKEYYQKRIQKEKNEIINSFSERFPKNATTVENNYSYALLYNRFNKYLNDIAIYIKERGISNEIQQDDDYIINYLKISAVQLFLELQEQYGIYSIKSQFNLEEIIEKYFNETTIDKNLLEKVKTIKPKTIHKTVNTKTSFGYKNRDTKKLFNVLDRLHLSLDFLEHRTTTEHFHKLLIAENYNNTSKNIYLQCETTQFSYIVKVLKQYFNNFTPTTIERSGKFYTKTGTLLKANNLHKNSIDNPKEKETIDNIIKQLQ